jgi:hypothetical protein
MRFLAFLLVSLGAFMSACTNDVGALQVCGDASVTVAGAVLDLNNDPLNCGCVGRVCPEHQNATATCSGGECGKDCLVGWGECDSVDSNGCETSLSTVANCGLCGRPCPTRNGQSSCQGGVCTALVCDPGFADCDRDPQNGCETGLMTDSANCGMCENQCVSANARGTCARGRCEYVCNSGFDNCVLSDSTVCGTNTLNNPNHCGSCNRPCPRINATPLCTSGVCGLQCAAGYANCDNTINTGCEEDLMLSPRHCGGCGNSCGVGFQNITAATCVGGRCDYSACTAGHADCDGRRMNGCEVDILSSGAHCGACGNACGPGFQNVSASVCRAGRCDYDSCRGGFADCDGVRSNGCEVNLTSDIANCGSCRRYCSAPRAMSACVGGGCRVASCNSGWGDCNGSLADGCERSLFATANCGSCGRACGSGQGCDRSGACVAAGAANTCASELLTEPCPGTSARCPTFSTCVGTPQVCMPMTGYVAVDCATGFDCSPCAAGSYRFVRY